MRTIEKCPFLGSSDEIRKIRAGMFLSWVFSILIPIVLIIAFNVMTYGTNALKAITSPDYFNRQVYQLKELNDFESFNKYTENLLITQPSFGELETLINQIDHIDFKNTPKDHLENFILLVRKDKDVILSKNFGPDLSQETLEAFANLPTDILPTFQPGRETNNETIFHETGYVIARQQDFFFDDGDQGSIFYLRKYTNIPGKIATAVGRNILYVMGMMFIIHTFLAFFMAKRFTKPVENMITATEHVMNGEYDYRIPEPQQQILSSLINSLNDMFEKLDKGQQYQKRIETMRSEFIANLSHDMKTPLTSIKIHAQAIKDGITNTPEKLTKYVENILIKGNDMEVMLGELKIFNELEIGTGNYVMHQINFEDFLFDVVEELRYDVAAENIELNFTSDVEEPIVQFDPTKIKRVINNIIFNSVKYADVRPLRIDINLVEHPSPSGSNVILTVSDNGVGVPDSELEKLFDQYYRVDPARNQTISGSGLGLSIAKSIIRHHNGEIYARKSDNGGLAIIIKLDCEVLK